MKEFLRVMRQYVKPYKLYLVGSLIFNLLSAVLNVFSFVSIIPMLQMLFGIDQNRYEFIPWSAAGMSIKDIAINNMYWYTTELMDEYGAATALLFIGHGHTAQDQLLLCLSGHHGAAAHRHRARHTLTGVP